MGRFFWPVGFDISAAKSADEALTLAKLDYKVEKRPVFTMDNGQLVVVPRTYAIFRTDTRKALDPTVGEYYRTFNNEWLARSVATAVNDGDLKYVAGGALKEGRVVFLVTQLPGDIKIKGMTGSIEKYLMVWSSHNGSSSLQYQIVPIIKNSGATLNVTLSGRVPTKFKIRHTESLPSKLMDIRDHFEVINPWLEKFQEAANELSGKPLTIDMVDSFLKGLYQNQSTKGQTAKDTIKRMVSGPSAFDLFAATCEYIDTQRVTKQSIGYASQAEARQFSQLFGDGRKLKTKALETILALTV